MSGPEKMSAIARIASEMGRGEAHPRDFRGDEAAGAMDDLFAEELLPFEGQTIAPPPVKRGAGRPAGSPNRTTLQLKKLLLARGYRDPAEFLASIVSMDVRTLALELGCKPIEALSQQIRAASELMPYHHQRMPIAVEHSGDRGRPVIAIIDSMPHIHMRGGDVALDAEKIIEAEQRLNEIALQASHEGSSHDGGKDE